MSDTEELSDVIYNAPGVPIEDMGFDPSSALFQAEAAFNRLLGEIRAELCVEMEREWLEKYL